ncbi:tumor necrosis factor receptor superfamily member 8 [Saccopteryx bilineata]|uniref:tumor necrosis factor receptor superfamily member 8 n=1 Tax=Saccopteryx bilineata TaxID=59482 RepID=UPI00338D73B0
MCALRVVLGLFLLGAFGAFQKGPDRRDSCPEDLSFYYDEAARRCCYLCPVGLSTQQLGPRGLPKCWKQCPQDHYLDRNRCTACVSCRDDLVEKKPCSCNSPRVCECKAGMFCATSATLTCARCSPHSTCPPGMIVKFPGTAKSDTVCEPPPPGTSPDCSTSPENCKAPTSSTTPRAKPTLTSASSDARTMLLGGDTPLTPEDNSKVMRTPNSRSSVGKPSPNPGLSRQHLCPPGSADCRKQCEQDYYLDRDGRCTACVSCSGGDLVEKTPCTWNSSRVCECRPGMFCVTSATNSCARCTAHPTVPPQMVTKVQGPVLFWVLVALVAVISPGSFLLCHRRACWKCIRQKLHLCYPVQTFQPKTEPADSRPQRNQTELKSFLVAGPGTEELGLMSPPAVETSPNLGPTCLENLPLLGASPEGSPSPPRDLPEPRVTAEHTNNRIEKIYIMKADTVIVGTVKTEVPEGRGVVEPAGPELEEDLEVDHAPHYPEQETEPPLDSCRDVMFSVEEEGKEQSLPTTASGK